MKMKMLMLMYCGMLMVVITHVECELRDYRDPWKGLPMLCSKEDPRNVSISCHGVRIVKRVIQQLLERAATTSRIQITDGISIVDEETRGSVQSGDRKARTLQSTILGLFEGKELRIKLSSLLPFDWESLTNDEEGRRRNDYGLGGGKKGNNNIFIMALLMGKMLGVIGFSTLGFLTMKALMASSLALMLSIILAAKKFSTNSQPSENHIVYAAPIPAPVEPHQRRRRHAQDIKMSPYHGWLKSNIKVLPKSL
ncbi:uncharacterized protein LOC130677981 [Microplitis mediator]|uniref:uncharacterized protein LOC130677981 n=1 Tax=Microplitis mediator TaxID=375433 RepID=UPI002552344E|nr:uncharacterized protein LOC130677981 [Microplitis mediator]